MSAETSPRSTDTFSFRHIGPTAEESARMLEAVGSPSLDALIAEVIPRDIRRSTPLDLPAAETEAEYLRRLRKVAARNRVWRSYIGMGYYDCVVPSVIARNVFENPSWYTPYTPYQAEIAQGRLESLLNFQTMVRDLTAMEIANASLLDESTAAAEAMTLLHRVRAKALDGAHVMLVAPTVFPQTLAVLRGRAEPLGLSIRVVPPEEMTFDGKVFAALLQYPDGFGNIRDIEPLVAKAHAAGALVAVCTDLLALTLLKPPGECGADVVVGSTQRLGVPLGYGGPHAAFFATREAFVRQAPGRIIGQSLDAHGQPAYRMALQTREQHIRREKATSNICTAQALLANMTAFYGVFHGPEGLREIASRVHRHAQTVSRAVSALGYAQLNARFFDTLHIDVTAATTVADLVVEAAKAEINLRDCGDGRCVGVALDETVTDADVMDLVRVFALAAGKSVPPAAVGAEAESWGTLTRRSRFMTQQVFAAHRSETRLMRYIKSLERKDVGLDQSMIPLGSCTMKLNAAAEMVPVSWPAFARLHPFAPVDQAAGYAEVIAGIERTLAEVTGFSAVSLQPNSGAQGELAGLMVIRAYQRGQGQHRDVVLIPSSAHGTNPATAAMAGLKVVVVTCDAGGNVDLADLRLKAERHRDTLCGLMVTYPSTHGVYEHAIREMCRIVHEHGGQVYMDGANMNAQVGLTSPALIGADVCHLNLHKTFAIPHGGGGPGMGPIAVAAHLAPYLPGHDVVVTGGPSAIAPLAAAPWGSASILLISYGYMCMLGPEGMREATRYAILNANYIKARLEQHFPVLYTGAHGRVAHELIFDLRPFKAQSGIDETDVAKRLMDFGFHAPTVSFPVPGTLMVEPTESESKDELDRFCDALLAIRSEIQDVIEGRLDRQDNPLKHAPHTASAVSADAWPHAYSRERAAYPLPFVRANKFWPSVGRVDNPYGDRHLVCACGPMESYVDESASVTS